MVVGRTSRVVGCRLGWAWPQGMGSCRGLVVGRTLGMGRAWPPGRMGMARGRMGMGGPRGCMALVAVGALVAVVVVVVVVGMGRWQ